MCTSILLKSQDGGVVSSRTVEFGFHTEPQVGVFPSGLKMKSCENYVQNPGFEFTTQYGFTISGSMTLNLPVDGMNEKGFYLGGLYHSGFADYPDEKTTDSAKTITITKFFYYLLANCASVDDAVKSAQDLCIVGPVDPKSKTNWPFHLMVSDSTGASKIIEFLNKEVQIYDNAVNTLTNDPGYPWHLTNLRNYMNIHAHAYTPYELANLEIKPLGDGTGGLGMPGDFTPPSRFVRATAYVNAVPPQATTDDCVFTAFHVLNQFDLPDGFVMPERGATGIQAASDITLWTTSADQTKLNYYWKTHTEQQVQCLDLKAALSQFKEPVYMNCTKQPFTPLNRTTELQPLTAATS